jgi:hypothetical protein
MRLIPASLPSTQGTTPVPGMRYALGESRQSLRAGGTYPPTRSASRRAGHL